jgi:hypothetical protein
VAEWLARFDMGGHLVLDERELAGMWDPPAQVPLSLAEAATTFASLAVAWSPDDAQNPRAARFCWSLDPLSRRRYGRLASLVCRRRPMRSHAQHRRTGRAPSF